MIPLVIDGAAVLATIVVISSGQRLAELEAAKAESAELERQAERARGRRRAASCGGSSSGRGSLGFSGRPVGAADRDRCRVQLRRSTPRRTRATGTAVAIADYLTLHPGGDGGRGGPRWSGCRIGP